MIAAAAIAIGLLLAVLAGGHIRAVGESRLRFESLVILMFVVQAVARGRLSGTVATPAGLFVWVASTVVVLVLLVPEWRRAGVWVLSMGMAANLVVVLLNGGMPVALGAGGLRAEVVAISSLGFYHLAGSGTLMSQLGDVVLLEIGRYRVLMSPGDVLMIVGLAVFIVAASRANLGHASAPEPVLQDAPRESAVVNQ